MSNDMKPYTTLAEMEADPGIIAKHGVLEGKEFAFVKATSYARLLATARAGLADRERLDWLERTLVDGDTDTYGLYDQAAKCWYVGDPPIRVDSLRAAIDKGSKRSGRVSPNGGDNG